MAAPTTATEHLLPVLVHVQANLSEDLSLEQVAQRAELSPFHFHRLFHDTIGETLKQYTQRLRLERAAYHLKIQDTTILDIAFNLGFNSHEAFTRAFKRWFGVTPRQFRLSHGRSHHDQAHVHRQSLNQLATTYQLSRVTVQKLNPIPVAFIRHLGSYLEVDTGLFDALIAWADARGLYTGDNLLIGVGHDDPNITSADKTRFDVCLSLPEPVSPDGRVGTQTIPAGHYATASYVGPYGPTMMEAYGQMFQQMTRLEGIEIIGLPAVEIYRTTQINPDYDLNHTDIYLPVRKI